VTLTRKHQTVHDIDIAAPVEIVYRIIAEPARWPLYFTPTVHVDRTEVGTGTERLRIWATGNGVIRAWSSIRTLDPDRHFIAFRQEVAAPPVKSMAGTWQATTTADGQVQLVLTHDFAAVDDDPASIEWISQATNENSTRELANVKALAESWHRRDEIEFSFEDSVWVDGKPADVYAFLHDAAEWPQRLPHVARLDLREEDDDMQQMLMWTRAKDGSTHLTESARVCFPEERIVYKQTTTPALIAAHTGEWLIEPADTGILVHSRHTVLLNDKALGTVPAAGTTCASTRDFVRASIGGNSRATLELAKNFVENR
jgi:aromatase/bifunctional cyclase/aromatase